MVPPAWMERWPANVWMGTSAEDQARFDLRYPHLAKIPAQIRFISAEPLLGPIHFSATPVDQNGWALPYSEHPLGCDGLYGCEPKLRWIITGGESGGGHRSMDLEWVRRIRDDCANVAAFFHKQGGAFRPGMDTTIDGREYHEFPTVYADLPGVPGGVRAQARELAHA
jgi:protein gp37